MCLAAEFVSHSLDRSLADSVWSFVTISAISKFLLSGEKATEKTQRGILPCRSSLRGWLSLFVVPSVVHFLLLFILNFKDRAFQRDRPNLDMLSKSRELTRTVDLRAGTFSLGWCQVQAGEFPCVDWFAYWEIGVWWFLVCNLCAWSLNILQKGISLCRWVEINSCWLHIVCMFDSQVLQLPARCCESHGSGLGVKLFDPLSLDGFAVVTFLFTPPSCC